MNRNLHRGPRAGGWWRSLGDAPAIVLASLLTFSAGCTALKPSAPATSTKPPVVESKPPRTPEEREAAIRKFEEQRENAQLGEALDRWKLGDSAGSEALLLQLLGRNPAHREARRALADLYVAKPDPQAALGQLQQLLKEDSTDAQAHHSLGLLLDTLERRDDALRHLAEAQRLAPQNELYTLSLEACQER